MDAIIKKLQNKCEAADVFDMETINTIVGFEHGRLKSIDTAQDRGMVLRMIVDGKLGQGYATNLNAMDELVDKVHSLAEVGDPAEFEVAAPQPDKLPPMTVCYPEVSEGPVEDMISEGEKALALVKAYDPDISAYYTTANTITKIRVLNTKGVEYEYVRGVTSSGLAAELVQPKNIIMLSRTVKGLHKHPDTTQFAHEIIEEMEIAKKSVQFPTGKFPIILTPVALGDVFMAFVDSVNGDMIAKGTSPLLGKIGEQILDKRISILDDPLHPDGTLSAPFDDEGTISARKTIIENGVLKQWLASRRAAHSLNMQPTGNGLRTTPFDRQKTYAANVHTEFSNLIMSTGDMPYKKMLEQIDFGIEIHYITGILLGNLINGDFAGNLEVAYRIENGKRVGRIKDAMISGNFFTLFKNNLRALGDQGYWSGSFGGVAGSMLIPYVLLDGVDISGKE